MVLIAYIEYTGITAGHRTTGSMLSHHTSGSPYSPNGVLDVYIAIARYFDTRVLHVNSTHVRTRVLENIVPVPVPVQSQGKIPVLFSTLECQSSGVHTTRVDTHV